MTASSPPLKKPSWIRAKAPTSLAFQATHQTIRKNRLVTVCEEAACPNRGECWAQNHAAFMILGEICTRACRFCNIATGRPDRVDPQEPERIAQTVLQMKLQHVVITSVDRDDLQDGGAQHFAHTIEAIRYLNPQTTIEILTPDFLKAEPGSLEVVIQALPDVFNHNLETVPRLYPSVRPGARYFHSLQLLSNVKKHAPRMFTKSGLMVGLGETHEEIYQVMDDLRAANVDFLTIGQYLQPTPKHHPVMAYIHPETFEEYTRMAKGKGFLMVSASPLTRSSYHADRDFQNLRQARDAAS